MKVRAIEADRFCVIIWEGTTLDDSSFTIVDRIFDSADKAHFFWCTSHRGIQCHCINAVTTHLATLEQDF